jgi:hypothetical protein
MAANKPEVMWNNVYLSLHDSNEIRNVYLYIFGNQQHSRTSVITPDVGVTGKSKMAAIYWKWKYL